MPFTFKRLREDDLPLLHEWRNRPHVVAIWDGDPPTLEEIRQKYLPRITGSSDVVPYIASLDGEATGYVQSYVAVETEEGWWSGQHDRGVLGIDLFLADGERLGQGLGTRMVRAFVGHLFRDPEVHTIQVDPAPDNPRAIRCYEKAGFRPVGEITTPDGPALYMLLPRAGSEWDGG